MMNRNQRRAAVATMGALCLTTFAIPYRYTYHNELCRITSMCGSNGQGGESQHGTRYAPLWASPARTEVEYALLQSGNQAMPRVEEVELDTGRLTVVLLAIGLVSALSIMWLGRVTDERVSQTV